MSDKICMLERLLSRVESVLAEKEDKISKFEEMVEAEKMRNSRLMKCLKACVAIILCFVIMFVFGGNGNDSLM